MELPEQPSPGSYYISLSGQLMHVKLAMYEAGQLARVTVEYLDGRVDVVASQEWYRQVVARYADWLGENLEQYEINIET